ncbi:MAG TPA: serine hydrolase domain-containing protein [Acetobacteraceae bacterium]|nr:serine hydrolase domain-containing protein [Acetobacteraceae bacterium]
MQSGVTGAARDVGFAPERLARLDGWMRRQVEGGRLAGLNLLIWRRGALAYQSAYGMADAEAGKPFADDTIVRIYSMTKPLTSVAIMMLYEEGHFQLDDPITRFLPCFADMRVFTGGSRTLYGTEPAQRDITFRDLLTHTSGLTYGFMDATPVDALYREQGVDFQTSDATLGEVVEKAASQPLLAHPGTAWNYSIATDVLGHLVAVISGMEFGDFLRTRVLLPLGMVDTDFHVPAGKVDRFAACYGRGADDRPKLIDAPATSRYVTQRRLASGGGGLTGTAGDYLRFCRFMLNAGELDGVRLLGRKTVELMTSNHLRGDMADMGQARFSESTYVGIGFGLGFSVMLDPARAQIVGSPGEYAWGGAASTSFWCDPAEQTAAVMLTQLMPSSSWPIRRELRVLTYQAMVD